jgi:hypothetical protein
MQFVKHFLHCGRLKVRNRAYTSISRHMKQGYCGKLVDKFKETDPAAGRDLMTKK